MRLVRAVGVCVSAAASAVILVPVTANAQLAEEASAGMTARSSGTASPAPASDPAGASGEADANVLGDIVVTATRRAESLQRIPVSVTAVTPATMQAAGVADIRTLTRVVPGFFGGKNLGLFLPTIRGVGSSGQSAGDEANVATYVDGVYQPDPWTNFVDMPKVERIEVLRGPQGTVFGRNATGGLINVITPDPKLSPEGEASIRYGRLRGNASDIDARAYVTGGLGDSLAADFAVLYRDTDDYVRDLVRGGRLGGNRVYVIRSKLLWQPSDTSQIVFTADYSDSKGSTNTAQPLDGNTAGRRFAGAIVPTGAFQTAADIVPYLNFRRFNASLRTHFELGAVNLETTGAYMHGVARQRTDSDSSSILLGVLTGDPVKTDAFSQEIRLLSAGDGPFKWLLGLYGFRLDASATVISTQAPTGPAGLIVNTTFRPALGTTSYSGFGEGTYELAPSLFLTGGVRYTYEKREFRQNLNGVDLFGETSKSFEKTTYRASARYEFSPRSSIYASYGTGYKSGVYNFTGTARTPVNPETIDAFEVGIKADPLTWLRANASAYKYKYDDLQVLSRSPTGVNFILQNAASAKISGGELELTAIVDSRLRLRASGSYNHANYEKFPAAQTFVPLATGGNSAVSANVSGNILIRAPRTTINGGFDWTHDLATGKLTISGNAYHSSRVYFDTANRFSQKPYTLVGAEVSWTNASEHLTLSLWAVNLTDARIFREIRASPLSTDFTYETPRRIGVGASYKL